MTNKEAIQEIEGIFENVYGLSVREREALETAIEALKTETKKCPNCGSDLYEYCFMCCYEGKKVIRNDKCFCICV